MHSRILAQKSLSLLLGLGLAAASTAQVQWTPLTPSPTPGARSNFATCFDLARNNIVLFGGSNTGGQLNDTWTFSPSTGWVNATPTGPSPSPRIGAVMTFDLFTSEVILFGGIAGTAFNNETWSWNGTTWTQRTPATSPTARVWPSLALDLSFTRPVLFGGLTAAGINSETWYWDGSDWVPVTTANTPPARFLHRAAWSKMPNSISPPGGGVTIFGGAGGGTLGDCWTFTGTDWVPVTLPNTPPARNNHGMAYDYFRERLVIHGGPGRSDTFEFDPTTTTGTWIQRTPTGTAPFGPVQTVSTYSTTGGAAMRSFDFSGITSEYAPTAVATFVESGAGCMGSNNNTPRVQPTTLPWTGESADTFIRGLLPPSPATLAMMVVGFTAATPPIDMTSAGAPGCFVFIDPAGSANAPLTVQNGGSTLGGISNFSFAIPASSSFIGTTILFQAADLDLAANALGFTFSNVATATVGEK